MLVVQPNIATIFSLQQQYTDLQDRNQHYDETILTLTKLQSLLGSHRSDFGLLEQALPRQVDVHTVIRDIDRASNPITSDKQELVYPGFTIGVTGAPAAHPQS